ncbi:sigma-70 family RNA polymerase sigma factor [Streptomyces sp. P5-A9]|uniref:sigma-70 family RNA polymerase sigma factor n=2 Tax=unclassified Streptomyces TaxID=2593676 RepID=UPI002FC9576C
MDGTTEARTLIRAPGRAHAWSSAPNIDGDAFIRNVYDHHGPALLGYAARLLDGDWHKAEDILQETVARAWKHTSLLTGRHQHLRPWLFTVARNLVYDHLRTRKVRPLDLLQVDELEAPGVMTDSVLTLHVVLDALQDLNDQQQTMIRLMYCLDCSVAQAAEHLGIPPGTVKSRTFYAVRALRKALERRGGLDG